MRLGFLVVGLLLALGLMESVARAIWPDVHTGYPHGMFVADEAIGFRLAPDFRARHETAAYDVEIRTSSDGYRSPELREKESGTTRVLALGDSFGFGHGVENDEAYPAVLGGFLSERGHRIEVINAGVPGYGTDHEYAMLVADSPALEPDIVLVGLYVGNDFRNHEKYGTMIARSGVLVTLTDEEEATWWLSLRAAVLVNSRLAQVVFLGDGGASLTEEEIIRAHCKGIDWDPGFTVAMVQAQWDREAQQGFETTTDWLRQIRVACESRGSRLLVALVPGPFQYDSALWNMAVSMCNLQAADYDVSKPNREMVSWCTENGVEVLDLLPTFVEHTTRQPDDRLYLDVHFNGAGHRLAAKTIADHIAQWLER